jgi:outer membrane receptor protein involved in Fe transport
LIFRTGVENLFDRNYYYREGFPEPGRSWYFNMRYCY